MIGASGAAETAAIKMLVVARRPPEGTIWRAAGLRVTYLAQCAFHHLETRLQETPTSMSSSAGAYNVHLTARLY